MPGVLASTSLAVPAFSSTEPRTDVKRPSPVSLVLGMTAQTVASSSMAVSSLRVMTAPSTGVRYCDWYPRIETIIMPSVSFVTILNVPSSSVVTPQSTVESACDRTATVAYGSGSPFSSTTFPFQSPLAWAASAGSSIINSAISFFIFCPYDFGCKVSAYSVPK